MSHSVITWTIQLKDENSWSHWQNCDDNEELTEALDKLRDNGRTSDYRVLRIETIVHKVNLKDGSPEKYYEATQL